MNTEKKELTDNELIAQFMGAKYWPKSSKLLVKYSDAWDFGTIAFGSDQLKYNTSWDWLMSVVEKINTLPKTGVCIYPKHCMVNVDQVTQAGSIDHGDTCTLIKIVYVSVVNFIKWHNSQPKI
jgi:hypothetical protein